MMGQQLFDLVLGTLAQAFTAVLWLRVLMHMNRFDPQAVRAVQAQWQEQAQRHPAMSSVAWP